MLIIVILYLFIKRLLVQFCCCIFAHGEVYFVVSLLTRTFATLYTAKIAHGQHAVVYGATPAQEQSIRLKGLECIVSVLKCMVEWSNDLYVNPHQLQSNLGTSHSYYDNHSII